MGVDQWDVRQRRRARGRCHCQCAQLAGSDELNRRSKGIEHNLDPNSGGRFHSYHALHAIQSAQAHPLPLRFHRRTSE